MKSFQETPDSIRLVDNLSIEWAVRAALRRDPRTASTSITVECDQGAAKLAGVVGTEKEVAAAAQVAASVAGVSRVDNQLKSTAGAGSRYRREG
jgi:osmotically-inducible protein OsmY